MSQCVGGRMSDKEIVEKSQLMEHLLPGKVVCVCVCVCVCIGRVCYIHIICYIICIFRRHCIA